MSSFSKTWHKVDGSCFALCFLLFASGFVVHLLSFSVFKKELACVLGRDGMRLIPTLYIRWT